MSRVTIEWLARDRMVVADLGHRRRVIRTKRQRHIWVTIEWLDKDIRAEDELVTIDLLTKDRPVTAGLVHHGAVIQGQNGNGRSGTPSGCYPRTER